jgi:hypothetical protein
LGIKVRAKHRERETIKAIQEVGGSVYYDYECDPPGLGAALRPPGPAWLRMVLGDDFFADVSAVFLRDTECTDSDLRHLREFLRLKSLSLKSRQITDDGLIHLAELRELESVALIITQLTDAGLVQLYGLTRLKELSLHNTQVTDAGVEELQKALPNLKIYR